MGRRSIIKLLLNFLFPPKCPYCCKLLSKEEARLCNDCQKALPWLTGSEAEQRFEFISLCVSPLRYWHNVRESVHRFKFYGKSMYADAYGYIMAQCVKDHFLDECDFVSWVPLSKKSYRKRGYEQAKLLADSVAGYLKCDCVSTLRKGRETKQQSTITDRSKRRANVLGAYQVMDIKLIQGKRILLVDDVVTSGATLSECARVLLTGGAARVDCVTLCRTFEHEKTKRKDTD